MERMVVLRRHGVVRVGVISEARIARFLQYALRRNRGKWILKKRVNVTPLARFPRRRLKRHGDVWRQVEVHTY
jgi:hypothetical protein